MLDARLLAEVKKQLSKGAKGGPKQMSDDDDEGEDGYAGSSSILDSMGNQMASLPKPIVKRVNALKNIQLKLVNIETKFYEELHLLECKYTQMYEPLYDERVRIINGEYEPSEEETKWEYNDIFAHTDDLKDGDENKEITESDEANNLKGIPGFWLEAFKNAETIADTIQEHDEPILTHLKDVRVKMNDSKPYGFALEFFFNENEYFTNKVLTKSYELTTDLNKEDKDPLGYDGPVVYKCKGTTIDWAKGKNPTVKLIKKKQKHKGTGTTRMITKEEKQESFFKFFETPTPDGIVPSYRHLIKNDNGEALATREDDDNEFDEDLEKLYEEDFEIGRFLKEFMIPKCVLYFTGELVDEGDYEDEDDDDEEDEDEEDDDEEEEENEESGDGKEKNIAIDIEDEDGDEDDENAMKKSKKRTGGKLKTGKAGKGKYGEPSPNECKQS